jgi:predicted transcriptional regulator
VGTVLSTKPPSGKQRTLRRTDVQPEDLRYLDVLHKILRLLNEPKQSAAPLARLVEKMPVLEARVRRAYRPPQWYTEDSYGEPDVTTVLVMLGNRGFEAVLLELLEDLTVMNGELKDQ